MLDRALQFYFDRPARQTESIRDLLNRHLLNARREQNHTLARGQFMDGAFKLLHVETALDDLTRAGRFVGNIEGGLNFESAGMTRFNPSQPRRNIERNPKKIGSRLQHRLGATRASELNPGLVQGFPRKIIRSQATAQASAEAVVFDKEEFAQGAPVRLAHHAFTSARTTISAAPIAATRSILRQRAALVAEIAPHLSMQLNGSRHTSGCVQRIEEG